MNIPAIQVKDLSFRYPQEPKNVLSQLDLAFSRGERVAIVGKNGAGKTTLAKMISGLLKPTTGQVLLEGTPLRYKRHEALPHPFKVCYIFQNPDDQIFQSTVEREICYPEKTLTDKKYFSEIVHLCGLEAQLETHPYNLPWSQRKFVTIASILMQRPDCIILDEPTAGQDHQGLLRLETILEYLAKNGTTVLMISHDVEFVAKNFARVIALADSTVLANCSVQEFFYDFPLVERAHLLPPFVPQLIKDSGAKMPRLLTLGELTAYLEVNTANPQATI